MSGSGQGSGAGSAHATLVTVSGRPKAQRAGAVEGSEARTRWQCRAQSNPWPSLRPTGRCRPAARKGTPPAARHWRGGAHTQQRRPGQRSGARLAAPEELPGRQATHKRNSGASSITSSPLAIRRVAMAPSSLSGIGRTSSRLRTDSVVATEGDVRPSSRAAICFGLAGRHSRVGRDRRRHRVRRGCCCRHGEGDRKRPRRRGLGWRACAVLVGRRRGELRASLLAGEVGREKKKRVCPFYGLAARVSARPPRRRPSASTTKGPSLRPNLDPFLSPALPSNPHFLPLALPYPHDARTAPLSPCPHVVGRRPHRVRPRQLLLALAARRAAPPPFRIVGRRPRRLAAAEPAARRVPCRLDAVPPARVRHNGRLERQ